MVGCGVFEFDRFEFWLLVHTMLFFMLLISGLFTSVVASVEAVGAVGVVGVNIGVHRPRNESLTRMVNVIRPV